MKHLVGAIRFVELSGAVKDEEAIVQNEAINQRNLGNISERH